MFSPSLVAKRNPISSALRADQPRELPADLIGLRQHLVERDRLRCLAFGEYARRVGHGQGNRRDVGRVQVEPGARDRKILAHAQRIVRIVPIGLRTLRLQGRERSSSGRDADELSTIELHRCLL